jgi:hypothetical protein
MSTPHEPSPSDFERRRLDHQLLTAWRAAVADDPNPLLRAGAKYFSQFDEDGILAAILGRLGLRTGRFLEIGVGDGTENNSLLLMAQGWRGQWIGGEPLAWSPSGTRLEFTEAFVTAENVRSLVTPTNCDLFALDIDGNDYWVARALLPLIAPRVVVVEYNAKFPPPVRFVMPYEPEFRWQGDDYFGASLSSWIDLLAPAGYRLVCCSYMGVNAFFIRDADTAAFADVPSEPERLFRPARYAVPVVVGHPAALAGVARRSSSRRVASCAGEVSTVRGWPCSTTWPSASTSTRVAKSRTKSSS